MPSVSVGVSVTVSPARLATTVTVETSSYSTTRAGAAHGCDVIHDADVHPAGGCCDASVRVFEHMGLHWPGVFSRSTSTVRCCHICRAGCVHPLRVDWYVDHGNAV